MANESVIKLVSRESFLAMAQSIQIQNFLKDKNLDSKIFAQKTQGDVQLDNPLYQTQAKPTDADKAFFTKELENELLNGTGDLAVHSLKDLPTELPQGLTLLASVFAKDKTDCLVSLHPLAESSPEIIKQLRSAKIGTSSLRRMSQVTYLFSGCQLMPIRGNVITRLQKLSNSEAGMSVLLLASAGLERLLQFKKYWFQNREAQKDNLEASLWKKLDDDAQKLTEILENNKFYFYKFNPEVFAPAVAQGILGLETSKNNIWISKINAALLEDQNKNQFEHDRVKLERDILAKLEAGCHLPFGLHIKKTDLRKNNELVRISSWFSEKYHPDDKPDAPHIRLNRILPLHNYQTELEAYVGELKGEKHQVVFTGKNTKSIEKIIAENRPFFHLPLIETTSLKIDNSILQNQYDCVVYSSQSNLTAFDCNLLKPNIQIIAVGPKTKVALENSFTKARNIEIPNNYNSVEAAKFILERSYKKVLWLGARDGITDGVNLLREANKEVTLLETHKNKSKAYQGLPNDISSDSKKQIWIFTSPSTVDSYFKQNLYKKNHLFSCLGQTTAKRLLHYKQIPYHIATKSELSLLAEELCGISFPNETLLKPWSLL